MASTAFTDDGKNVPLIFTTKKNVDGMFLGIFFAEKNKFVDTLLSRPCNYRATWDHGAAQIKNWATTLNYVFVKHVSGFYLDFTRI